MTGILEIEHASKHFGGVAAVDDVTLSVESGSITAVIGPNGAGKTTLFNIVSGFEPLDYGEIRFEGERLDGLEPWQVARRGLFRSFQTPTGFPVQSVWENLMVAGSSPRQESFTRAIFGGWGEDEVGANNRAKALLLDLGLWDRRDALLVNLPPGDVKLVDFARLLMTQPKMLLLDEPAAGVDARSIGSIAQLIKRLQSNGITILVIDHNIGFVLGIADQVHVMARGASIAQGTPGEIVENDKVIEIYLGRKT